MKQFMNDVMSMKISFMNMMNTVFIDKFMNFIGFMNSSVYDYIING